MENNEKLELIINEEKNILKEVKESLMNNNNAVMANFQSVKTALFNIDNAKNQIVFINKIEDIVIEILNKIANATTVEEIIELRNNLNKEIKKVRNILSKVEGFDMTHNEEIIKNTRNTISKLLRVKKREEKIDSIKDLISKDELSIEDKELLNKKLKNEKSFIKRNKSTKETKPIISLVPIALNNNKEEEIDLDISKNVLNNNEEGKNDLDISRFDNFLFDLEQKRNTVIDLCEHYNISDAPMYDEGFIKNIVTFFKNIKLYKINRACLYIACRDYNYYSRIKETQMIIDYLTDITSLKSIINRLLFHKHTILKNDKHNREFIGNVTYIREIIKSNCLSEDNSENAMTYSLACSK